jgi:protein required for attachment to host cells
MDWVIVSDSTSCFIYEYQKHNLHLIKEISHPENKLKDVDLTSDKPGRYQSGESRRGSYEQKMDPKAVKINEFIREIAKMLDHARIEHAYKNLILITPPHISGLFAEHLNPHVKNLIRNNIHKDIVHVPMHELLNFLREHAEYPD